MNPLLQDLIGAESSGKNVTNERQSTSSGRARGFFQITDGTWRDFGRKAGIDFNQYPTALAAPYQVQLAVAKLIPLGRWDKITLNRLSAKGHKFDTRKTLGENLAALGETGEPGSKGAPLPAAAAVVTGAGQPQQSYASPETPVPGATQPNYFPEGTKPGLADVFSDALGGAGAGGEVANAGSGGGGGGGGFGDAPLDANVDLRTKGGDGNLGAEWDAMSGKPLAQLADLFDLPTIGQPNAQALKAQREAQKGWI